MFKIIGALLILLAGGILGFAKAAREQKRLNQGSQIKRFLYLLKGEIRYGCLPLPDAISNISGKMHSEISPFLETVAYRLNGLDEESFRSVWKEELELRLKPVLEEAKFLHPLESLGETIGYLDQEMQQKTIDFAIEEIDDLIFQMKDQVQKNCRLYRRLGISLAALIVIVLL